MIDGWGVYAGAVSIHAMTVPLALHPSIALRAYAYDAGVVRARAYLINNNNNKQ